MRLRAPCKNTRDGAYTSERHGAERRFDSDDKNALALHMCLARRVCARADIILTAAGDLLFIRGAPPFGRISRSFCFARFLVVVGLIKNYAQQPLVVASRVCDIGGLWFQQIERRLSPAPAIVKIKGFCCFLYFTCDACAENISRSSHDEGKCKCADGGAGLSRLITWCLWTRENALLFLSPLGACARSGNRLCFHRELWGDEKKKKREREKGFHKLQQTHALHIYIALINTRKNKVAFFQPQHSELDVMRS